jgi:hypothetical protein
MSELHIVIKFDKGQVFNGLSSFFLYFLRTYYMPYNMDKIAQGLKGRVIR